jgi:hypothetical protein
VGEAHPTRFSLLREVGIKGEFLRDITLNLVGAKDRDEIYSNIKISFLRIFCGLKA